MAVTVHLRACPRRNEQAQKARSKRRIEEATPNDGNNDLSEEPPPKTPRLMVCGDKFHDDLVDFTFGV
jgi:hypothetical protein